MRRLLFGTCIAVVMLVQSCGDRLNLFYPSLADAKKAGEIDRGWIPAYLPGTARAIRLAYDPASPRTWCGFDFSSADYQDLRKNLTHIDALPPSLRHVGGPGEPWWPGFLTGNLDSMVIRRQGFELYVVSEPDAGSTTDLILFALNSANGRGFFYRTPRQ